MNCIFHEVMNIKTRISADCGDPHSYRLGHRDARHEAADILVGYDSRVKELESALHNLVKDAMASDFNEHWDSFMIAEELLTREEA